MLTITIAKTGVMGLVGTRAGDHFRITPLTVSMLLRRAVHAGGVRLRHPATSVLAASDLDLALDLRRMPEAVVLKTAVVALDGDLALDLHRMPEAVVLKTAVVTLDGVMDRDPGIFQQASGG